MQKSPKSIQTQSNPSSLREAGEQLIKLNVAYKDEAGEEPTKLNFVTAHETAEEASSLADLASLAQTLNAESDDVNGIIQLHNEKLRALNFGLEVWCKGSDGDYGFARVEDQWQLATQWDGEDVRGKKEKYHAPLLKSSRNERIEGLELVPAIRQKLKSEAERKIAAIRNAKQFVASL